MLEKKQTNTSHHLVFSFFDFVHQGMYHGNSRDGEGVMTYPGGRQDVGVWRGTKLIKLKFAIQEASFDPWSLHPLSSCHSLGSPDLKSRGKHGPMGPLEVS